MTSPLHSIRWRLQLWHGLILIIALGGLCTAVYQLVWQNELRRIDRELAERDREVIFAISQSISTRPVSPPEVLERIKAGGVSVPASIAARFQGIEPGFSYFSFRDRDGHVLLQSSIVPTNAVFLPLPERGLSEDNHTIDQRREVSRSSDLGVRAVFGRDISPEIAQMHRFAWSLGAAGLGVWLLGLAGGWWLAGRAIRPIKKISRTACRIAEGNLDERITTDGGVSELDQLSGVLNRTFDRLRNALEQQRQFTADAAHELRTPITILTAETQRILKRDRSVEEYRAAFEGCGETIARMRHLVEDLLLLARQESTNAPREQTDLALILRDSIDHLAPLAAARNIQLHANLQSAPCLGHAPSLAIIANNLLANAIQHHHGGGNVHLSTRSEGAHATLTVRDDGPGIASEDLPHIFDRFYRADKSRTASASLHTGLGLAIVKTVIAAHGGTVECRSTVGKGSLFVVCLPLVETADHSSSE